MSRVLVLADDRLGPAMAGPAIRAVELARALSAHAEVTLASTQPVGAGVDALHADDAGLRALVAGADVVVTGGLLAAARPWLLASEKPLVVDLYAPCLMEDLASLTGPLGTLQHARHRAMVDAQMRRADFLLCASERQRDYYLGRLCALGRLTPEAHDPAGLLAVVPFGLPAEPPQPGPPRLPAHAGPTLLWGGGLWDWLDPLAVLHGLAEARCPEVRLAFCAGPSPNPTTPASAMNRRARSLAAELGLSSVLFLEDWVPYAERGSLLLEADAGVMAHPPTLESRFAFRTRALDCLWAGRPILCSAGDAIAELVAREGLGAVCAEPRDWAPAIRRLAHDPGWAAGCRERMAALRPAFQWERVAAPLAAFVSRPRRHPSAHVAPPMAPAAWQLAYEVWRAEGLGGLLARAQRRRARRA